MAGFCYSCHVAERTGRRLKTEAGWSGDANDAQAFAASVGERIRVARQKLGWTQVELAEAASLSSNYVARLERGELGPSLMVACRIAEALGIGVDSLVSAASSASRSTRRRVAT